MFSDDNLREQLRSAENAQALYELLINWDKNH
jgi:mannitol/fructose-specific phosphotransferase system IIA component (Ntr-type)